MATAGFARFRHRVNSHVDWRTMRPSRTVIAAVVWLAMVGVVTGSSKVASFGFVCAKPGLPPGIKPIVAELMVKHHEDGTHAWGDRAVSLQLRRGSSPTYFVPLSCGA